MIVRSCFNNIILIPINRIIVSYSATTMFDLYCRILFLLKEATVAMKEREDQEEKKC